MVVVVKGLIMRFFSTCRGSYALHDGYLYPKAMSAFALLLLYVCRDHKRRRGPETFHLGFMEFFAIAGIIIFTSVHGAYVPDIFSLRRRPAFNFIKRLPTPVETLDVGVQDYL